MLPLSKKVIVEPLISACCGLVRLFMNKLELDLIASIGVNFGC